RRIQRSHAPGKSLGRLTIRPWLERERVEGMGFVEVDQRVVAAREHGGHVVSALAIRIVDDADGAMRTHVHESIRVCLVTAQREERARAARSVQHVFPAPGPAWGNAHALHRRLPLRAGDDAAMVRAEPDQHHSLASVPLPDELPDVQDAGTSATRARAYASPSPPYGSKHW